MPYGSKDAGIISNCNRFARLDMSCEAFDCVHSCDSGIAKSAKEIEAFTESQSIIYHSGRNGLWPDDQAVL